MNEAQSPNTGTTKQTRSWADDYDDDDDDDEDNLWWAKPQGPGAAASASHDDHPYVIPVPTGADLIEAMESLAVDHTVDAELTYAANWEVSRQYSGGSDGGENNEDPDRRSLWAETPASGPGTIVVTDSLWEDELPTTTKSLEVICRAHGVICRPGICQEMAHQQWAARKEAEREEKKKKDRERAARRKGKGKGKGDDASGSVCGELKFA